MNEPRDNGLTTEEQFSERARELFDDSVERLDAATLSRLNQARHAALAELAADKAHGVWLRWVPITGVAAAALVAVIVMRGSDGVDVVTEPLTASDFELLLDDESLEMLEDLEFYSWLETADLDDNGNVG